MKFEVWVYTASVDGSPAYEVLAVFSSLSIALESAKPSPEELAVFPDGWRNEDGTVRWFKSETGYNTYDRTLTKFIVDGIL